MKKAIESLVMKTQKHIENTVRNFDFNGYFDKKPYKKIRNRLAKEYAEDVIDSLFDQFAFDPDYGEETVEHLCNQYLDDGPYTGGFWEEGAEDYIWGQIEKELKK